jgi:hypothetical protein
MSATDDYPAHCRNGHEFKGGTVLLGWERCTCTEGENGHRYFECRACEDIQFVPPCSSWPEGEKRRQRQDRSVAAYYAARGMKVPRRDEHGRYIYDN